MKMRRILKVYSSMITKNIPLFLAVGLLNILFAPNGWFPNPAIGGLARSLYNVVVPVLLGYDAGKWSGRQAGGIAGAIAAAGLLEGGAAIAIPGAIVVGFCFGYVTNRMDGWLEPEMPAGFEMLGRNLLISGMGILGAWITFYGIKPVFLAGNKMVVQFLYTMMDHNLLPLFSVILEPFKLLFLNNLINHGLLIPLGMEQLEQAGKSVLFLLETNPGPGLGILLAVYFKRKMPKKEAVSAMGIHFLGGIHEVYIPYVLSDLCLLPALMAGAAAGSFWFDRLGAGLKGPVSPGSIINILLLAPWQDLIFVAEGVILSVGVAFGIAWLLLSKREEKEEGDLMQEAGLMMEKKPVRQIAVVCDGGLGSSAMGAALLRRKIKEAGLTKITVQAAAGDDIPPQADLLVCQKDFFLQGLLGETKVQIWQMNRLTAEEEYRQLVDMLKKEAREDE